VTINRRIMDSSTMKTAECLRFKDLENYIFTDVGRRFRREHSLGAFDLFSIVMWKANRAKSQVAKRLLRRGRNLESVARRLTSSISRSADDRECLRILRCDWGPGLPMASAILSVCYPDRFSVYDERVCEELGGFENLRNITNPERLWAEYERFLGAVRMAAPRGLSLRDCDRYL
jgi:hypothetical protein